MPIISMTCGMCKGTGNITQPKETKPSTCIECGGTGRKIIVTK